MTMKTEARKQELLERRIRQRTRKRGFTPVPNARIEAQIRASEGIITASYAAGGGEMPPASKIRTEAINLVRNTLPATPIGVRTRGYI